MASAGAVLDPAGTYTVKKSDRTLPGPALAVSSRPGEIFPAEAPDDTWKGSSARASAVLPGVKLRTRTTLLTPIVSDAGGIRMVDFLALTLPVFRSVTAVSNV